MRRHGTRRVDLIEIGGVDGGGADIGGNGNHAGTDRHLWPLHRPAGFRDSDTSVFRSTAICVSEQADDVRANRAARDQFGRRLSARLASTR